MDFPALSDSAMLSRLEPPSANINMVLDTDTFNEIDDQFAVAYSLLSPEKLNVEAIYAAPFSNANVGPAEGMELSYEEILRVLDKLGRPHSGLVFRGSTGYLPDLEHPYRSNAALDLVQKAMAEREGPLYVAAIGAITNVASAILIEPRIIERIVVVWLAGQPYYWPTAKEFNLRQDPVASRLIFDCGVPLVHIPCNCVATHLLTTLPEMEARMKGRSAVGDYLFQIYENHIKDHFARSKVIWDIAAIAWLLDADWVPTHVVRSPVLTGDLTWSRDDSRHFSRVAALVHRDPVYRDMFTKVAAAG